MYLSKIKMKGFKSFAETTEIVFSKGISAIVGPNGSGKSNITDAIRWVLGEQSTKSLRGKKMEDVIFAGTMEKAPLGYAEVVLFLDNTDGSVKDQTEEIQITRRLFRTGESEYKINQKTCKLKEIHQIFSDTGLGKNGYSLISQGEIEKIITSGPMELRSIVEEAVGIVNVKTQKQEAERKLMRTKDNMDRIMDILSELEKRRGPLKRQAKKAREYLAIHEELKSIDLLRFVSETERMTEQITEVEHQLMDANARINTINQKLSIEDRNYREQRKVLTETAEELEALGRQLEETETRINGSYGEILVGKERIRYLGENRERLEKQSAQESEIMVSLLNEKEQAEGNLEGLNREISELQSHLDRLEKEAEAFRSKMESQRIEAEDRAEKEDALQEKIRVCREQYSAEEVRLNLLHEEETRLKGGIEKIGKALEEQSDQYETAQKGLARLTKKKVLESKQCEEAEKQCKALEESIRVLENNLQVNGSQIAYLKGIQESFSDYFPGIQMLMTSNELNGFDRQKIYGPVGELLTVPTVYAKAIDVALGNKTQNIVVENVSTAARCIDLLKKHRKGRATFLPLDNLRYILPDSGEIKKMSSHEGFVGMADRLVSYDHPYKKAVESLLSRVIVTEDFESASAINKAYKGYTVVTLEGEIFHSGGAIVGGAAKHERQSPLYKKAEIQRLTVESETMKKQLSEKQTAYTKGINERDQLRNSLANVNEEIAQENQKLWQAEQEKRTLTLQNEDQQKHLQDTLDAINEAEDIMFNAQIRINTLENQLSGLDEKKRSSKAGQESDAEALDISKALQAISDVQVALARKTEQQKHGRERLETLTCQIHEQKIKTDEIQTFLSSEQEEREATEKAVDEQIQAETQAKEDKIRLQDKRETLLERQKALTALTDSISKTIGELNHELVLENEGKNALEVAMTKATSEKEHLEDTVYSRYEMNLLMAKDAVKTIDSTAFDASAEHQRELRGRLNALGQVNVSAIEESAEVEERYDFMKGQYDDLTAGKKALETIIADMYKTMEKQFVQGFEQLQEIFSRVFSVLFNGGVARLDYADPEHIMESGIELTAQPPGKKLRHISLLSGGETAMTAIALLFSFLELNPSPFCVIDEIDAALDDANIQRFTAYMTSLCQETQFMIITHRKKTLEACDEMYGVTMTKAGVSKLISVRLSDYIEPGEK